MIVWIKCLARSRYFLNVSSSSSHVIDEGHTYSPCGIFILGYIYICFRHVGIYPDLSSVVLY